MSLPTPQTFMSKREHVLGYQNTDIPGDGFIHHLDAKLGPGVDAFVPRRLVIPSDVASHFAVYGLSILNDRGEWVTGFDFLAPVPGHFFSEIGEGIKLSVHLPGGARVLPFGTLRVRVENLTKTPQTIMAAVIGHTLSEKELR